VTPSVSTPGDTNLSDATDCLNEQTEERKNCNMGQLNSPLYHMNTYERCQ